MLPKPRIALAHDHLFQVGGAERVLQELHRMYPEAPIFTLIYKKQNFDFLKDADVRTSQLQRKPGGVSFFKWYLGLMPQAWESFDFSEFDIVISSASAFAKGIITPQKTLHISYCHSPTRYLWSDSEEYVKNVRLPSPAKIPLAKLLERLREWDLKAAGRVDHFIANSNYIAERIRTYYNRDSTVIYPPVDVSSFYIDQKPGDYYLVVSRLRPYKKVDLVIEAFNNLKLPLVVIGGGEELSRLKALAKKNVSFLGEVDERTKRIYLSRCRAFIHPQVEDFGISAVEAMASGRPVIAFGEGGARETIEEGITGFFFPDQSWESLAYAILKTRNISFDARSIRQRAMRFDLPVFRSRMTEFISQKYRP